MYRGMATVQKISLDYVKDYIKDDNDCTCSYLQ